jgi:glyoxylase-like metal-dependent hydrolase (beta-lactamase superfamily II)
LFFRRRFGKVDRNIYRFTVGEIECIALLDAIVEYPVEALVERVDPVETEPTLTRHGLKRGGKFASPYTCLLIKIGKQNVLVDTGVGDVLEPGGRLLVCLQETGVEAEQIDVVILSHAHGDHVGGNTDKNGRIQFPKARWVMAREEWEFWTKPENVTDAFDSDVVQRKLFPISDRIQLVQGEGEIAPGVFTVPAPGHTPGHLAIVVRSEDQELIYTGDAMLHPIHVEHPDWCASDWADLDCEGVIKSRRMLYERAAGVHALVLAFHCRLDAPRGRCRGG